MSSVFDGEYNDDGKRTEGTEEAREHNEEFLKSKMNPETRERVEGLMHDMIEGGLWGYKNKTDPTEREVAFQSEATAEKLFAYLYADDPTNAKKKWQEFSGKPADKGLISRAESLILEKDPNKAVEGLAGEQQRVTTQVKKYLHENDARGRERELSNMRIAMGDSEHRQRELRRKGTDQILAEERDMDGAKLLGVFVKGATRVADDYNASWREGAKTKHMRKVMSEIAGNVDLKNKSQIFQEVRGTSRPGFSTARDAMQPGKSSMFSAAGMKMGAMNMASIIMKMSGAGRRNAEQNAPEQAKQLLLPAPGKHFGGPGFQGPEMGLQT